MMYLHYCEECKQIFLLCGHQHQCLKCGGQIYEIKLDFNEYVDYTPEERSKILESLRDDAFFSAMKRTYRFSKRTKRYKAWKRSLEEQPSDHCLL